MQYTVEYRYDNDEKKHIICNESALKFKKVKWEYEGKHYNFIYNDTKPYVGFFGNNFILILYLEDSPHFPPPENLVLYNLKKEVIKVIPPPIPIHWKQLSSIFSIGEERIIDGRKYIEVWIGTGHPQDYAQVELRYLDLETFEYHPTENRYNEIFQGR